MLVPGVANALLVRSIKSPFVEVAGVGYFAFGKPLRGYTDPEAPTGETRSVSKGKT